MEQSTIIEKRTETKLNGSTRIAYGCGDAACNIVFGMIATLLTLFYTDYAGISVAAVGLVMLLSRVFDGTSDMIMGFIVNRTRSKWGKARPWILWMSVPYCIAAISMFMVPQSKGSLQFWYIFVTYNLCTTVFYTAINVPYGTLSTMMTRSSHERDLLSVFRMAMAPIGRILSVTLTMPVVKLFGDDQAAWIKAMSLWAAIALILLIICFSRCEENIPQEITAAAEKVSLGDNLRALFTNQYFWSVLILWTVTCVHGTIVGTSLPYYCKYIFGNDEWMYSVLYLSEAGTLVIGAMICPFLLKKINKRNLSLTGAIIAVVSHAAFMLNPGSFSWALGTSIVRALGEAPLTAVVFGMLGDAIEFGHWKTNIRQESLIFGGASLGFKIGTGITSAVITSLLDSAGYVCSTGEAVIQPMSAIAAIRNCYIWGPILVWGIAVITLLLYQLDNKYDAIMVDLAKREVQL